MKRIAPSSCSLFFVAAAAACSSPAAVKITLTPQEPAVQKIELEVRVTGAQMAMDFLDCQFTAGKRMGKCTLEASHGEWGGCHSDGTCDPLSFIVYGSSGAKITVAATGLDASGSPITSVSKDVTLQGGGSEVSMVLVLPAASFPSCVTPRLSVAAGANDGQSFVAPVPGATAGSFNIYALSGAMSSLWSFSANAGGGCTLTSLGQAPACGTVVGPNAAVIGDVADGPDPEVVALCYNPSASGSGYRIMVAPLAPSQTKNLSNTPTRVVYPDHLLGGAHVRVSNPVLADLDGDGKKEVVYLVGDDAGGELTLKIWTPDTTGTGSVASAHIQFITNGFGNAVPLQYTPLVYPQDATHDALVIAGYAGGFATYDHANGLQITHFLPPQERGFSSDWGPAIFKAADGTVGFTERLRIVQNVAMPNVHIDLAEPGARRVYRSTLPLTGMNAPPGGYVSSRTTHIAIGDVKGDGTRTAVVGDAGTLVLFPITPGQATTAAALTPLTSDPLSGGMTVLLANLDRQPGLEIISYTPTPARIYAVNSKGASISGFPLTVDSGSNVTLRAFVEDLDNDGSIEIVTLLFDSLKVFMLGPGTYNKAEAPWPLPARDLAGGSADVAETDPLRP